VNGPRLVLVGADFPYEPEPEAYLAGRRAAELAIASEVASLPVLIAEAEYVLTCLVQAGSDAPRTRGYRDALVAHRDRPA
jgi:hypothetical protein